MDIRNFVETQSRSSFSIVALYPLCVLDTSLRFDNERRLRCAPTGFSRYATRVASRDNLLSLFQRFHVAWLAYKLANPKVFVSEKVSIVAGGHLDIANSGTARRNADVPRNWLSAKWNYGYVNETLFASPSVRTSSAFSRSFA